VFVGDRVVPFAGCDVLDEPQFEVAELRFAEAGFEFWLCGWVSEADLEWSWLGDGGWVLEPDLEWYCWLGIWVLEAQLDARWFCGGDVA
jgi:hypothetical protein